MCMNFGPDRLRFAGLIPERVKKVIGFQPTMIRRRGRPCMLFNGLFMVLHNLYRQISWLRQTRLARGGLMFSTCPFVRPSVRPLQNL